MKKKKPVAYFIAMTITLSLLISGCGSRDAEISAAPSKTPGATTPEPTAPANQGITVNFINFTVVDANSLDSEKQASIESLSKNTGYYYWLGENGKYTILISLGMRPTSGYEINVLSVEDNEGNTNILVEEKAPSKDDMVAQVITYPYIIIEASRITDRFNIQDKNGNLYEKLDSGLIGSQMILVQYVGLADNTSIEVLVDGQPTMFRNNNMVSLVAEISDGSIVKIVYYMNDQGQRIIESITPVQDEVSETLSAIGVYQGLIDSNSLEIKINDTYLSLRNNEVVSMASGFTKGDSVEVLYMISSDGQIFLINIKHII